MNGTPAKSPGCDGWQIVYTGFVLILLCFFIMLTSFASLQQSKIMRFTKSFSNAVSVFNSGNSLEPGETMISTREMIVDKQDKIAALFESVTLYGSQFGLEGVRINRSKRGVVMTLADQMLFASAEADISASAHALLEKIGAIINELKVFAEIEGHTDDRAINSAAFASNWELSTARAVNVLRYLSDKGRVNSKKLSAVGLSEYHPIVPNSNEENRARNRRVEIIFRPETM